MREFKIACAYSRKALKWQNQKITWPELCDRLKNTTYTPETREEYQQMSKDDRDAVKDRGGFVGGFLKDGRRKVVNVQCRSLITHDVDSAEKDFLDRFKQNFHNAAVVYSTHSHSPEKPRYRVVIPLEEDITPDRYAAVSRFLAAEFGIEQYDPVSFLTNQLMHWPSTSKGAEYVCEVIDGPFLNADAYLAEHPGWGDYANLPMSIREQKQKTPSGKKQEDPLSKAGIVGAFCRTYSIQDAIAKFLPNVYAESAVEGRYDYIPGEGSCGVVVYNDKFCYSHHATDPAGGQLCNAFDLVRIHYYGDLDEKASYKEMCRFASSLDEVKMLAANERLEEAGADFEDPEDDESWKARLEYEPRSMKLENSLHNIQLILENDVNLKSIVFNQLADGMEIAGPVPWKHPAKFWRDADDAQLISYIDSHYGTFSARNYDIAVTKVADDRSYHPIREMFEALPPWDGVPRVDTLLIDYLAAQDNPYVRAVTRKALCAAYRRVYEPGIKFDYITVLNGAQGIGKSTLIAKLGMEWFSDSLSLSDMNDKTAAEKLQGYWILEIGELAGMKKADIDKVKAFVSRQDDKYRASFGRRVTPHLRQCVFFGTTNTESGYLRDITGNRRFWNVKVVGNGKYSPWNLDAETVQQIWAEVMVLAKAGEPLYLSPDLEEMAREEQVEAMEHDEREGIVSEYLITPLPDNWDEMSLWDRREYLRDVDDPTRPKETHQRVIVSNIEIWCECFGHNKEDLRPQDSYAISAIMVRMPGWRKTGERISLPIYGLQRIYRTDR